MTRPKVPDDKRQRTAQACDSCKRRKQKCNGSNPCQTCLRRKLTCCYTPNNNVSDHVADSAESPTKRRHLEASPPPVPPVLEAAEGTSPLASEPMPPWGQVRERDQRLADVPLPKAPVQPPLSMAVPDTVQPPSPPGGFNKMPSRNNPNGLAEETNIYTETRMLQDQTGRLLYMGDSSTLSILQLMRIIVENTAGTEMGSPFIDDPKRHRILETIIDFPSDVRIPGQLPDKETADVLIAAYFTNSCGLLEILDKPAFLQSVEECYRDPPSANNYFLCHLFLVLAVGLLLAAPAPGSREEMLVQKQLEGQPYRAELYFRSARAMCDPISGFEDADFWSIQALALMTIYMLIHSKRNAAYAYLGMAVRSAFAMGLHREETMRDVIFTQNEMKVRRNLWKTLFVLDRFLAAILGRPTAISEDDCSCKIMPDKGEVSMPAFDGSVLDQVHASSLDSCVETSHIIGVTLKIYATRKISTVKVQEIVDEARNWDQMSRVQPHRRQSGVVPVDPAEGIAALHVSLMSLHSLILLTRHLFVMHNWMLVEERSGMKKARHIRQSPMARYSEACVVAAYRTIKLASRAWKDGYLPRRNPFVIYFVFAASLVVLMNQFSSLYYTDEYAETMRDALDMVRYCAETDPQADRVLDIISRFAKVVAKWTAEHTYPAPPLSDDFSCLYNPTARPRPPAEPVSRPPAGEPSLRRQGSFVSINGPPGPDPGLLTPPAVAKPPVLDLLSKAPTVAPEARANGIAPPPISAPPVTLVSGRPSLSTQSSISSEPFSGNFEFEFDGLWNSFINYLPPVSTVAPGLSSIAMQFPPPALDTPTGPYTKPGF